MDLHGWIVRVIASSNNSLEAKRVVEQMQEVQNYATAQREIASDLGGIATLNDIPTFFAAEKMLLIFERQNYANSPEEVRSINNALEQLNDALEAFPLVLDWPSYKLLAKSYPKKFKKNEIPQDAVCSFLQSHITRLTNRLTSPLSLPEKELLRQRKLNMQKALSVYNDLQGKALELDNGS